MSFRTGPHALFRTLLLVAIGVQAFGPAPVSAEGDAGHDPARMAHKIGILGFGSLIADPGEELSNATEGRQDMETPFAIEFGRSSNTRGGAPTLVPVKAGGAKAKAVVFVLKGSISEQEASNILWRREIRQVGSGRSYKRPAKPGPNSVLVEASTNLMGLDKILYTDFADSGKLLSPTAAQLAGMAIGSARNPEVKEGMDGISYLLAAKKAGIKTPLSADYENEILRLSNTDSLEHALAKLRGTPAPKSDEDATRGAYDPDWH
jgi:hypothetical protein